MNDHLHRLYYKVEEAAQDFLTLLSPFEPVSLEWDNDADTWFITLTRSEFDKLAHPDSCKVVEHTEDRDGVQGLFYELQWGMSELLTFRVYITQEEYEKIQKAEEDIPF